MRNCEKARFLLTDSICVCNNPISQFIKYCERKRAEKGMGNESLAQITDIYKKHAHAQPDGTFYASYERLF